MKESYVVCKIKQQDRNLILCNSNHLGYQYSTNLYIELEIDDNDLNPFKNALLKAMCAIGNADKVYDCPILNEDNKKYIVLPAPVFEKEGVVLLSLGAINEDKSILTTNQLKLFVDASNPIHAEIAVDKDLWEVEVLKVMEQWFQVEVEPLLNTLNLKAKDLQKIAEDQQIQLTELIENIQKMLSDGDFNGSSILHGNGIPNNEIGKENDLYLDVSNTSETIWHIFAKENNIWVDKGGMQSKDSGKILVGTDLDTAEPKTLFIQNITQAQAIAETRGLTVNEYDARLPMNQVRISDEIGSQGLDEYIKQTVYTIPENFTLNNLKCIQVQDSVDIKTIKYSGNYFISTTPADTTPIDGTGCCFEVHASTEEDRVLIVHYRHNGTSWRNNLYRGVWSGWKLIDGEVLLWSGTAEKGTTLTLNKDISLFNTIVFVNGDTGLCTAINKGNTIMANANISDNTNTRVLSIVADIKSNTSLYLSLCKYFFLSTGFPTNEYTITSIYGRP